MCSLMGVALGAEVVGTVMQGSAAKQRGEAAKAAYGKSAESASKAAGEAIERGTLKDLQAAMKASSVTASQRVIQSGSGVDVNIGAPKTVQDATAAVSDVDRSIIRRNAALEAYGLREKARTDYQQGEYAEAEGNAAMWGTFLGGGARILGGAGRVVGDIKTPDDGAS